MVAEEPPRLFELNEKVLCFHGPLIYEGKTLKVQFRREQKEHAYFIHYTGWSKSWDEWVLESRVLKYSDANLEKQREVKAAFEEQVRMAKKGTGGKTGKKRSTVGSDTASVFSTSDSRSSTPVPDQKSSKSRKDSIKSETTSTETPDTLFKKRKKVEHVEPESLFSKKVEIKIDIPDDLKTFLVDDWDNIVRQRRLLKLPAQHTVASILESYLTTRKKTDMTALEFCNGVRLYFDALLGAQLLYRMEREQFIEISKASDEGDKTTMSHIYGLPHLIRFFTKLGQCLVYSELDSEAVTLLQSCVEDLLKYISKHFDEFFSDEDYTMADAEFPRQIPL